MTNTRHTIHRRTLLAVPTAAVVAVLAVTPSLAATTTAATVAPQPVTTVSPAPAPTTTGIIMRDGGVCDPIRHMGC